MALDREDTLKKAEKLLRQGRLDGAIAEYERVVEDQPRDWTTANTLGDLYSRAGQIDKAAGQYGRIADHLANDGFYPRAAALYRKILKIKPDDERTQLSLGEISAKLGLMADAKSHFTAIGDRRRTRGDAAGANEMIVRLGSLDPADIDARIAAARVLARTGEEIAAAMRFRDLHADLMERRREPQAIEALREAVRLNPDDKEGRAELARSSVAAGDFDAARTYLDRETAGDDPALLLALTNLELRSGNLDSARELIPQLLALDRNILHRIVELAWTLADQNPDAAFVCIDAAVDSSMAASDYSDAAAVLQEFVTRIPGQIPALLKLVEVCVDGGLETTMYETQAQLADAYLSSGQAVEARVIAEDLVAREPWERAHIDRFRRALVMLKVSDPDTLIAERLSGQTPFTATDRFVDVSAPPSAGPPFSEPRSEEPPPSEAPPAVEATAADGATPAVDATPLASERPAARRQSGSSRIDLGMALEEFEGAQPAKRAQATTIPADRKPAATLPPGASTATDQHPSSLEIDLNQLLGDLKGIPPMPPSSTPPPGRQNLDEVFRDFRDEVSRQTGSDDAAQHLKLARTYLEMGMADEAAASLKTASRSPRHRFEAASLLGQLYRHQKDVAQAIEWFERAAEAPAPTAEDGRGLLYDLGLTLQEAGETSRALAVFLELQAEADDYRDVAARVDHLARVQAGG